MVSALSLIVFKLGYNYFLSSARDTGKSVPTEAHHDAFKATSDRVSETEIPNADPILNPPPSEISESGMQDQVVDEAHSDSDIGKGPEVEVVPAASVMKSVAMVGMLMHQGKPMGEQDFKKSFGENFQFYHVDFLHGLVAFQQREGFDKVDVIALDPLVLKLQVKPFFQALGDYLADSGELYIFGEELVRRLSGEENEVFITKFNEIREEHKKSIANYLEEHGVKQSIEQSIEENPLSLSLTPPPNNEVNIIEELRSESTPKIRVAIINFDPNSDDIRKNIEEYYNPSISDNEWLSSYQELLSRKEQFDYIVVDPISSPICFKQFEEIRKSLKERGSLIIFNSEVVKFFPDWKDDQFYGTKNFDQIEKAVAAYWESKKPKDDNPPEKPKDFENSANSKLVREVDNEIEIDNKFKVELNQWLDLGGESNASDAHDSHDSDDEFFDLNNLEESESDSDNEDESASSIIPLDSGLFNDLLAQTESKQILVFGDIQPTDVATWNEKIRKFYTTRLNLNRKEAKTLKFEWKSVQKGCPKDVPEDSHYKDCREASNNNNFGSNLYDLIIYDSSVLQPVDVPFDFLFGIHKALKDKGQLHFSLDYPLSQEDSIWRSYDTEDNAFDSLHKIILERERARLLNPNDVVKRGEVFFPRFMETKFKSLLIGDINTSIIPSDSFVKEIEEQFQYRMDSVNLSLFKKLFGNAEFQRDFFTRDMFEGRALIATKNNPDSPNTNGVKSYYRQGLNIHMRSEAIKIPSAGRKRVLIFTQPQDSQNLPASIRASIQSEYSSIKWTIATAADQDFSELRNDDDQKPIDYQAMSLDVNNTEEILTKLRNNYYDLIIVKECPKDSMKFFTAIRDKLRNNGRLEYFYDAAQPNSIAKEPSLLEFKKALLKQKLFPLVPVFAVQNPAEVDKLQGELDRIHLGIFNSFFGQAELKENKVLIATKTRRLAPQSAAALQAVELNGLVMAKYRPFKVEGTFLSKPTNVRPRKSRN